VNDASTQVSAEVALQRDGDCVRVAGPLTMITVPAAAREGDTVVGSDVKRIDLSAVTDVDSAAVALLLEWARRVGPSLRIEGASASLRNLARLYSMDQLLPLAAASPPSS